MFFEAQVRCATVTSSRRPAGVFNEGRAASLEKKYQDLAITSRREAVTCFNLAEVEEELAPVRDAVFDMARGGGKHVALPARTSDQRRVLM